MPGTASETVPTAAIISPADQFARVIEQAIAPYAARLEAVSREAGELHIRLEQAERERDDLHQRLEAPQGPERPGDDESSPHDERQHAYSAPQREITASQLPRPWWRRLLDLG